MEWYLKVLRNYTTFTGRAHRTEFWIFVLFNFLISLALSFIDGFLGTGGILGGLYGLAVLLPGIAVTMRRLHDTNRSGWWMLIGLIPFIGPLVLIILAALPGDQGANRFGDDPKGATVQV